MAFIKLFTDVIKVQRDKYRSNKYCTNNNYEHAFYAEELIKFCRNSIYFSRYTAKHGDKVIKGKTFNAKHLEYVNMDVYNELYKKVLNLYLSENFCEDMKFQKTDTVFIPNKQCKELLGRNVEYKSKQGIKISFIVTSKNVPIATSAARGSDADCVIFNDTYNNLLIDPKTDKYRNNNRYKQYMLADAGYDSEEIATKLREAGYTVYMGKNLRRAKKESFKIVPISDKDHSIYNKRVGIENLNALIKQYGILSHVYEKTIESYMGLLLLVLSYIVYNKYLKIVHLKALDKITREREKKRETEEIERKKNARKLKRKLDGKQRTKEKELRKQQQTNKKTDNYNKPKQILNSVNIGKKVRYISIIKNN